MAKASDPKELQREIRELRKQLAERPAAAPERVEVPVLDEETISLLERAIAGIRDAVVPLSEAAENVDHAADAIANAIMRVRAGGQLEKNPKSTPAPRAPVATARPPARNAVAAGDTRVTPAQQRILSAVRRREPEELGLHQQPRQPALGRPDRLPLAGHGIAQVARSHGDHVVTFAAIARRALEAELERELTDEEWEQFPGRELEIEGAKRVLLAYRKLLLPHTANPQDCLMPETCYGLTSCPRARACDE